MGIAVRPYLDSDHDEVVTLWKLVFPNAPARNDPVQDIRRKLGVQPELFLVARVDSRIVGTTMAGFDGHRGWVHLVAVAPEFRRKGVATDLMLEAEARLRDLGCPKINLQIRPATPEVVGFYESLGFRVEERISMGKVLVSEGAQGEE
jgi:ribosomal protein S18 acetylase RimI-like enzyme